jgi:hypothetical protein
MERDPAARTRHTRLPKVRNPRSRIDSISRSMVAAATTKVEFQRCAIAESAMDPRSCLIETPQMGRREPEEDPR